MSGEYLFSGCDSLSDLRGMIGLVAPDVGVEFSAVVFRYEGVRLATKNPQLVIIRLAAGPYFLRYLKS